MEKFYRNLYGDKFDEEAGNEQKLKEMVMNQLLDKYLFLKKAEDMGVKVSGKEFSNTLLCTSTRSSYVLLVVRSRFRCLFGWL